MKKILLVLVLAISLIAAFSASAWAASDYTFNIATSDVSNAVVGDQVTVTVTLKNNAGNAFMMYAMQDYIVYDSAYLAYVDGSASSNYVVSFPTLTDTSKGQVRVSYLSTDGTGVSCNASTTLVTFKLKVLKTGATTIINNLPEMATHGGNLYSSSAVDATLNIGGSAVQHPTINCGTGGSYTLSSDGTSLRIYPNDNYKISKVTLNGVSQGTKSRLTGLVTGDVVNITFIKTTATDSSTIQSPSIKLSPSAGGTYTLSSNGTKLTITPNSGYEIEKVTLNGESQGTDRVITGLETGDTVVVTFKQVENTPTTNSGAAQFTDVPSGAWYYSAVDYVVKNNIFTGITSTTFEPNTPMSRAMMVTVLYRVEGQPTVSASSNIFPDVLSGSWYANGVIWGAANAIVKGYSNGNFGPNDLITREQLATIMYRYSQYKGYDISTRASLSAFSDASKVSSYAQDALQWAVGKSLIEGNNNLLNPQGNASRAEVATIMMRFMQMSK